MGVERLNLQWGHHKNSARTRKPIPPIMLPIGDDLTKVLTWWIKVGHFKLKQGTMVSDDEVSNFLCKHIILVASFQWHCLSEFHGTFNTNGLIPM